MAIGAIYFSFPFYHGDSGNPLFPRIFTQVRMKVEFWSPKSFSGIFRYRRFPPSWRRPDGVYIDDFTSNLYTAKWRRSISLENLYTAAAVYPSKPKVYISFHSLIYRKLKRSTLKGKGYRCGGLSP